MYDSQRHDLIGPAGAVHLRPALDRVMTRMARSMNRCLPYDVLIAALYPHPADEPDGALLVLRVQITHLRNALRRAGCVEEVCCYWGFGYGLVSPAPAQWEPLFLTPAERAMLAQLVRTHPDRALAERLMDLFPASLDDQTLEAAL